MSTCVRALWGTWKLEVGVMKLQYICILCIDFSVPAIEAEVWLEFQKNKNNIILLLLILKILNVIPTWKVNDKTCF
jgi:hypothetical protein